MQTLVSNKPTEENRNDEAGSVRHQAEEAIEHGRRLLKPNPSRTQRSGFLAHVPLSGGAGRRGSEETRQLAEGLESDSLTRSVTSPLVYVFSSFFFSLVNPKLAVTQTTGQSTQITHT